MEQSIANLKIAAGTRVWTNGKPSQITGAAVAVDLAAYAGLRCPGCGRRMQPRTQHTAGGGYRILCACAACNSAVAC
jgi:hypothetical protein